MKREDKFKQIAKEARAVLWALLAIIIFWIIAGLGISRLNITIFHTPLWVITGCVGTWIFSIVIVVFLMKRIFKDFSLEEDDGDE
ncbi:MAG: YhdT family protein [Eubacterium sp.]|nr:YhdT family protein [Eubacterium sp.]